MGTEEPNLPKLAAPARRALHGMGANAMQVLRNALREHGLSFRDG